MSKPHSIRFTDDDWLTLSEIAEFADISISELVNRTFKEKFGANNWKGLEPRGSNQHKKREKPPNK